MWYVVQVSAGREQKTLDMMQCFVEDGVAKDVFIPRYELQKCFRGVWHTVERPLFSGYLFVVTDDVERLRTELRKVPAFTRILGNDDIFTPLEKSEVDWLKSFMGEASHVVGMSTGVIEGDEVIVLNGPLFNQTALIQKINRRKRIAYLEFQMCGRTVHAQVGLSIVKKTT